MKKCSGKMLLLFAASLIFLFLGGVNLWAQEETSDTIPEELNEEFTLEEITVTAQKRKENQQKVPIAMDVVSSEDITTKGKTNVDDILSELSNVFIATNRDGMRVSVRGLTDTTEGTGGMMTTTPMVAINVDGAYTTMNNAGNNLFDVERVEVLYGPQSTLYSTNSPGGIVNVVTTAPKTGKYSADASYTYGSYDEQNIQVALNAPIWSNKIAMRLSGSDSRQGTWVEDATPSKTQAVRLKTLWETTDALSITLTGNWSKASSGGMMGGSVIAFVDQDDDTYPDGTALTDPWTTSGNDFGQDANTNDQITKGGSAEISWDTSVGALSINPSYSKSTSKGWTTQGAGGEGGPGGPGGPGGFGMSVAKDVGAIAQQAADDEGDNEETSQVYQDRTQTQKGVEARMTSSNDFTLFTWIAGGSYYKGEDINIKDNVSDGTSSEETSSQAKTAAFANLTYPLWFYTDLSLTVGYRQSWDDANHTADSGPTGAEDETMNYSHPDFSYGFNWNAADSMMVYGTYSSSYRLDAKATYSYDTATGQTITVEKDPERNYSYTLGLKSRWLDNKLQLNVSTFYYDYRNAYANEGKNSNYDYFTEAELRAKLAEMGLTSSAIDTIIDTANSSSGEEEGAPPGEESSITLASGDYAGLYKVTEPNTQGTGDQRSFGVDASISWVATSRDRVNLSVSYLDSKWTELVFDHYYDTIFRDYSWDGLITPNAPKWSLTASYEHAFIMGSFGTLTPHVDWQYRSGCDLIFPTFYDDDGEEIDTGLYHQEDYNLFNASFSYEPSGSRWYLKNWSLNASVKNITNYAVKRSFQQRDQTLMLGDPRMYSATFSLRF